MKVLCLTITHKSAQWISSLKKSANCVVGIITSTKIFLISKIKVLEKETVDTVSDRKKSEIDLQYGHPLLSMSLQ